MDQRVFEFSTWLGTFMDHPILDITQIPGDASTRRYFRVKTEQKSFILMDAPEQADSVDAFIRITQHLLTAQINVPEIVAQDTQDGFLLLTDFGNTTLLKILTANSADRLYRKAIDTLIKIQIRLATHAKQLPYFDQTLMQKETDLYTYWYLEQQLGLTLTQTDLRAFQHTVTSIISAVEKQPYVYCHRDYHSRNLMLLESNDIGVIDYQDAVYGPIAYDLVSLLRDCYIKWPTSMVYDWVNYYYTQAKKVSLIDCSLNQFFIWFDWTGLQRHMKAIGIFARLNLHDQKPNFLADIPRTTSYLCETTNHYSELTFLNQFIQQTSSPDILQHLVNAGATS